MAPVGEGRLSLGIFCRWDSEVVGVGCARAGAADYSKPQRDKRSDRGGLWIAAISVASKGRDADHDQRTEIRAGVPRTDLVEQPLEQPRRCERPSKPRDKTNRDHSHSLADDKADYIARAASWRPRPDGRQSLWCVVQRDTPAR